MGGYEGWIVVSGGWSIMGGHDGVRWVRYKRWMVVLSAWVG